MASGRYISYLRVSTEGQGSSGLGIEAQRAAVTAYLNGGAWALLGEYVEIESGKRSDRPKLVQALAQCRMTGATLIVAKLDRLSRNVAFLASLMDSGVEFVCCDNPHATRFTLHILAAVAEHEREMISARTKAALQAAKARGVRLGSRRSDHPKVNGKLGNETNHKLAQQRAGMLAPVFIELRSQGLSLRAMAAELNVRSIQTPRGAPWSAVTVRDVLARLPGANPPAPPIGETDAPRH